MPEAGAGKGLSTRPAGWPAASAAGPPAAPPGGSKPASPTAIQAVWPAPLSRRSLLGGSAVLALPALPLLGGCKAVEPAKADTSALPVLVAAITAEQDLVARYEAARSAHADLAWLLDPVLAHHRSHLDVLRRHYVPGSGRRAGEGGRIPASAQVTAPEGGPGAVLADLRRAETGAAARLTAAVAKADAGLAQVLASIGACEAGHAEALGRAT
ncbi:hypothetical protein [Actinomadura oligospora]|uniref:hypothetical protein n=1 Tax=Actinomadura oligospora TaxID=111804 RepID=UPI0004AE4E48|nr:hypothetical protein [Actinomadura oligospora]